MIHVQLPQCLDDLVFEIDEFSISDSVSTVVYNNAALVKIVRDKELATICKVNGETLLSFESIYSELGNIVSNTHNAVEYKILADYEQLESIIDASFHGLFHLYAKQVALSVKALIYYKMRMYEEAIAFTSECIELNELLIHEGMYSLLCRCVEQNKNIARIYQKQENYSQSNELLKNIFSYLLTGESDADVMHGCIYTCKEFWMKLPVLRESYTYELFKITVEDTLRANPITNRSTVGNWYSDLNFEVTNSDRQVIYNWIYINNLLYNHAYEEYVDSFIYFFKEQINFTYDPLKIFLIRDLYSLLKESNYVNTEVVLSKLANFLENKIISKKSLYHKFI